MPYADGIAVGIVLTIWSWIPPYAEGLYVSICPLYAEGLAVGVSTGYACRDDATCHPTPAVPSYA
jgi:hypothetical protein